MALTRPSAAQLKSTVVDFIDPLFRINKDQTGTNNKDIGVVFERGSDTNVAIIWDESADQFALISTSETGSTAGNVSISSYSDLKVGDFEAAGLSYPTSDGTNGQFLTTDGSGNLSFASTTATPAGSNTQVQYNNDGVLGASSNLTFDGTTLTSTGFSGPLTGNASTATTLATARTIGGVSFDGSANINLPGVNATGNQDTSGNASTATTLETSRTISLTGDATGSVSFDGSSNVSITTTVADDSHNHTISNVDGLQSALDAKAALASPSLTGTPTAPTASAGTNTTQIATTAFVGTAVSNLVSSAPSTLDTLNELAAALGDDANFSTTVSNNIAGKANNTVTISAGSGLSGGGNLTANRTISHADTSSQSSVNNSNGTVIQDITLDTYGHITGINSINLDGRYYTESEADSRFVNVTGDTMTGNLTFQGNTHIVLQENQYVGRRVDIDPDEIVNSGTAYILLCRNAGNNDVNGTITMDRTSGLRHAVMCDIVVSSGSSALPVGTCRSMGTAGNGSPSYSLVSCTYAGNSWIALKITNPDNYYDTSGVYFTGRVATTDSANELKWVAPASLSSIADFGSNESHQINGGNIWHSLNDGSGSGLDADTVDGVHASSFMLKSADSNLDMNNNNITDVEDIYLQDRIYHDGDTDTYIQFHAVDQWRVVTGGAERLEVNNSQVTVTGDLTVTGDINGTASSAKYADLAENYLADQAYPIGTVLDIGGAAEVTIATADSYRIAGTVSENPGYLMNSDIQGEHITPVAYIGRVPCRVQGTIHRGDMLIVGDTSGVAVACHPGDILPGQAVGKALESFNSDNEGLIEILVGRL